MTKHVDAAFVRFFREKNGFALIAKLRMIGVLMLQLISKNSLSLTKI
jgi:hypothetical protein